MNANTVVRKLRALCRNREQQAVAADLGVSPQYLSDILAGYRQPGPKVLRGLGIVRVSGYRKLSDER